MCLSAASSRRNKSCWVGRKALPPFVSDSFGPGNSSLPDGFGRFLCQHLTGGCSDASQPTGSCPAAFFLAEKCHRWKWVALSPPAKHTAIGRWQWWQLFLPPGKRNGRTGTSLPEKSGDVGGHTKVGLGLLRDLQHESGNQFVTLLLTGEISGQSKVHLWV